MAIETSSLDDTFYRHFFDPEAEVRDRAHSDLDQWFAQAGEAGESRYEITRQMICGIINAQNRRDAESEADANFATTNSRPNTASQTHRSTTTLKRSGNSVGVPFKALLLCVLAILAWTIYVFDLFTPG